MTIIHLFNFEKKIAKQFVLISHLQQLNIGSRMCLPGPETAALTEPEAAAETGGQVDEIVLTMADTPQRDKETYSLRPAQVPFEHLAIS